MLSLPTVSRKFVSTQDLTFILTFWKRVLLNEPVEIVLDREISSYRLVPSVVITKKNLNNDFLEYSILSQATHEALRNGQAAVPPRKHIPRPPNAWILYRQHHHAQTTALNPGVPNNDICESDFTAALREKTDSYFSTPDFHQMAI